jgi:hypothetical protein
MSAYNCMYLIPKALYSTLLDNVDSKSTSALQIRQLNNVDVLSGGKLTIRNDDKVSREIIPKQSLGNINPPREKPSKQPPNEANVDQAVNKTTFSTHGSNDVTINKFRGVTGTQTVNMHDADTSMDDGIVQPHRDSGMQTVNTHDAATTMGEDVLPEQRDVGVQSVLSRDQAQNTEPADKRYTSTQTDNKPVNTRGIHIQTSPQNNRHAETETEPYFTDARTQYVQTSPQNIHHAETETDPYFTNTHTQTSTGDQDARNVSGQTSPIMVNDNETSTDELNANVSGQNELPSVNAPVATQTEQPADLEPEESPQWLRISDFLKRKKGRRDIFSPPPVTRLPSATKLQDRSPRTARWTPPKRLPSPPVSNEPMLGPAAAKFIRSRQPAKVQPQPQVRKVIRSRRKRTIDENDDDDGGKEVKRKKPRLPLKLEMRQAAKTDAKKKAMYKKKYNTNNARAPPVEKENENEELEWWDFDDEQRGTKRKSKRKVTLSRRSRKSKQPKLDYPLWMQ